MLFVVCALFVDCLVCVVVVVAAVESEVISRNRVPGWLEQAIRVPDFLKSLGQLTYYEHDKYARIVVEVLELPK